MLQFKDDTFGPIETASGILRDLMDAQVFPSVKAAHFGTAEELEQVRTVEQRLSALEDQARREEKLRSDCLHLPTTEEVRLFGGKPHPGAGEER